VKNVKLEMNPTMIPEGRHLPSPTDPDKTMGSTGSMQGDRIVTIPAANAKARSRAIAAYRTAFFAMSPTLTLPDQTFSFSPFGPKLTKVC